jgi:hypothetical protein
MSHTRESSLVGSVVKIYHLWAPYQIILGGVVVLYSSGGVIVVVVL